MNDVKYGFSVLIHARNPCFTGNSMFITLFQDISKKIGMVYAYLFVTFFKDLCTNLDESSKIDES